MSRSAAVALVVAAALFAAGCGTSDGSGRADDRSLDTGAVAPAPTAEADAPESTTSMPPPSTAADDPAVTPPADPEELAVEVAVRVESRIDDVSDAEFEDAVRRVLFDERGWQRAGFAIEIRPDAPYRIVLAEPADADRLCLPYRTAGQFSCQIGPDVVLNADRWRSATPQWPGSVDEYRTMLVNHEFGHLLGQHHPTERCQRAGAPAAVMAQQSRSLEGCTPNPWPLDWEVRCAALMLEPLAPPYEASATPLCGPDGPTTEPPGD